MNTGEHICGLLGLIAGLLLLHLIFLIYREIRSGKRDGNCAHQIRNWDLPTAESRRVENNDEETIRWNRTLGILEDLASIQQRQVNSPSVIRKDPALEVYTGRGDVDRRIKKANRALGQLVGNEEDKVGFVMNHTEGSAAERLHNYKRDWQSVEEIMEELVKVYGRRIPVWDLYERMAGRKQGKHESVWEFLDVLLEMSESLKQGGNEIDRRMIGECVARNMREPALGLKLKRRIEQRPEDIG